MKETKLIIALAGAIFFCWSCSSEESCQQKDRNAGQEVIYNPNGDSELALAMRTSFDETKKIKQQLEKGAAQVNSSYLELIRSYDTITPTDPEVQTAQFKRFSKALYQHAERLEQQSGEEALQTYKSLVNTCISCHQSFCPGPIVRIEKLRM